MTKYKIHDLLPSTSTNLPSDTGSLDTAVRPDIYSDCFSPCSWATNKKTDAGYSMHQPQRSRKDLNPSLAYFITMQFQKVEEPVFPLGFFSVVVRKYMSFHLCHHKIISSSASSLECGRKPENQEKTPFDTD